MFSLPPRTPAATFIDRLYERGVKLNYPEGPRIRAVTHRMIEAEDVDWALERMEDVARELSGRPA
jgi:urease gamma subunit